jgi:hypothetical protein
MVLAARLASLHAKAYVRPEPGLEKWFIVSLEGELVVDGFLTRLDAENWLFAQGIGLYPEHLERDFIVPTPKARGQESVL